jgi:hypothetical protein
MSSDFNNKTQCLHKVIRPTARKAILSGGHINITYVPRHTTKPKLRVP